MEFQFGRKFEQQRFISSSILSAGVHTISFQVQDNNGVWSNPVKQSLTIYRSSPSETTVDNNKDSSTSRPVPGRFRGQRTSLRRDTDSIWARGGDDSSLAFQSTQSGSYEVWEWHSSYPTRTNRAPYRITHSGGQTTINVDQRVNGGQWNSLGVYSFVAGGDYTVTVTSVADDFSTCADAIKWTLAQSTNSPPIAFVDSITPNPADQGQTVTFTGHGSDTDGSVTGYRWSSNLNGNLSSSASFSSAGLSAGVHTITFQVKDDDGVWSNPVLARA